ncbi:Alpha-1,2-Mannosidase [Fusarium sp. LHS14.1]|nr:Alpha-1,2-Mannosidase [Fusarium sp. LHS14.1]
MLLPRVLPLILGLADCACALYPENPNYEAGNYKYDLSYQLPGQRSEEPQYRDDPEKTEAIAEAFRHSWMGYYTYAFPRDTLNPLSETFENDLSGFGSTAIESLTTAIIMGEKTIMDRIMWYIGSATFYVTKLVSEEVNVYEATIRLIGSMVSAYDLLNGPYRKYVTTKSSLNALLDQSVILTEALKVAFGSKTRIPAMGVLLTPVVTRSGRLESTLGTAGGMGVELDGIHHRTGLKKLWKNFVNGFKSLIRQDILHGEVIPGLFPDMVNTKQGGFFGNSGGYTKNTAAFYFGMIKLRSMDSRRYRRTGDLWVESVEPIMKHLTSHPMNHPNLTFLAAAQGNLTIPRAELTSCSAGAMFLLGGATLKKQRYIDFGLRIAETCWTIANSMPSGLPPRVFKWVDAKLPPGTKENPLPPVYFEAFANETGFWPTQRSYTLESDIFETMYYAYRMTGDTKWQDRAWDMFLTINSTCRVENGFVGIKDVTVDTRLDLKGALVFDNNQWINKMEGEWMSRTLKYLYLMFAPNGPWQLKWDGDGAFVFSHGGHLIQKPLWRSLTAFGGRRRPVLKDWDEIDPRITGAYQGTEHEG